MHERIKRGQYLGRGTNIGEAGESQRTEPYQCNRSEQRANTSCALLLKQKKRYQYSQRNGYYVRLE